MNEHELAAIEQRAEARHFSSIQSKALFDECSADVDTLIAALRAMHADRDEFRASFLELFETTRRYREALVEIRDRRPVWGILEGPYDGAETWVDAISRLCKVAAVALATPGAGDPATTEERGSSS